jgi:cobalamin biosynthesis protein CobT
MSADKNKIILKKLKALDTIWHPESTLVFKSSKEKVVIGRYVDDELLSLDNIAVELCEKWKFKYDKDLLEEDANEDEEEGENEEGEADNEEVNQKSDNEEVNEGEVNEGDTDEADVSEGNSDVGRTSEISTEETLNKDIVVNEKNKLKTSNKVSNDSIILTEFKDFSLSFSDKLDKFIKNSNKQISDLENSLSDTKLELTQKINDLNLMVLNNYFHKIYNNKF